MSVMLFAEQKTHFEGGMGCALFDITSNSRTRFFADQEINLFHWTKILWEIFPYYEKK